MVRLTLMKGSAAFLLNGYFNGRHLASVERVLTEGATFGGRKIGRRGRRNQLRSRPISRNQLPADWISSGRASATTNADTRGKIKVLNK
jgi:hypothetical protein